MDILDAIKNRSSTRAFLDKPVDRESIATILDASRWAPSGVNTQPWHIAVLQGKTKLQLSNELVQAHKTTQQPNPDYSYYPDKWSDKYKQRRFECGMALYGALNIKREDHDARQQVWEKNYHFFDAPVGLVFYLEKDLNVGSWMDIAMFIQNVMLAAQGVGLATCPQASIAEYPDIVRSALAIDNRYAIVSGMALGYPDMTHSINQYRTKREDVEQFTQWYT